VVSRVDFDRVKNGSNHSIEDCVLGLGFSVTLHLGHGSCTNKLLTLVHEAMHKRKTLTKFLEYELITFWNIPVEGRGGGERKMPEVAEAIAVALKF
jgi:hypothetical protein